MAKSNAMETNIYYTWVDVEEKLLDAKKNGKWPGEWLVWIQAYWDSLTLGIHPKKQQDALEWLAQQFGTWFNMEQQAMILEGIIPNKPRLLKIEFEETTESPLKPTFVPLLRNPSTIWPPHTSLPPEPLPIDLPPVIAFHSFKGGVGRTLHASAFAYSLTKNKPNTQVLLIDADLEAPGLTWMLQDRFTEISIAFVDLLTLAHGDPDPTASDSLSLVANRLNTKVDSIYILPAFRNINQFTALEVKPEHLVQSKDPFILTTLLANLGKQLNVKAVIVDLRAGLSELSTGLLLDPRVYKVLVTTLSDQSIKGTSQVIKLMGELAPAKQDENPNPALIISQIPFRLSESVIQTEEEKLLKVANPFLESDTIKNSISSELPIIKTNFYEDLSILPDAWDEVIDLLNTTTIIKKMNELISWLPSFSNVSNAIEAIQQKRQNLVDFTYKLIYAETSEAKDLLVTPPLTKLASDFSNILPIVIVVGAKGSGKTYTFVQMVYRKDWEMFRSDVLNMQKKMNYMPVLPVLSSNNLGNTTNEILRNIKHETASLLRLGIPKDEIEIRDYIENSLTQDLQKGDWRIRWLNIIAWSLGFKINDEKAGESLPHFLREQNQTLIALMDGLEDLFQNLPTRENEQIALRVLLQDVPNWLKQQPNRPLGLIVFVRQDFIINAIKQNAAQLQALYEPYALKWGLREALQLVAWIARQVKIPLLLPNQQVSLFDFYDKITFSDFSVSSLNKALVPLWGQKLGRDHSKEARSTRWVMAALSDLNGQIQARDIIRFLYKAAENSINDTDWDDRILTPNAMKDAMQFCSDEKITEVEAENPNLEEVFDKLRKLPDELKQIPFTYQDLHNNLERKEIDILMNNGVINLEKDEYYMPEIFRQGLGFTLQARGRPKVLALFNKLHKWS